MPQNKYLRSQPAISTNSDSDLTDDIWMARIQREAVQPKREQKTLFDQINSIMNGTKSKYTSVQNAVDDMKARSGLTAYLEKMNKTSSDEEIIPGETKKTATPNEDASYYERGLIDGKYDLDKDQVGDIAASIRAQKASLPFKGWHGYAKGYRDGAKLNPDQFVHEWAQVLHTMKMQHQKVADTQEEKAVILQKCPQIQKTLENYITDTKGNLPVSAVIEKIKSIHRNDTSDAKDWDDEKLIKLVSDMNLEAKKNNPNNFHSFDNLGKRDILTESEIDPSNVDIWSALMPAKY